MRFSMFFLQRIVKRRSSFSVFRNPTSTYAKYLQEKRKGSCELRDLRYKQFPTMLSDHREFMNYLRIISQGVRPFVSMKTGTHSQVPHDYNVPTVSSEHRSDSWDFFQPLQERFVALGRQQVILHLQRQQRGSVQSQCLFDE